MMNMKNKLSYLKEKQKEFLFSGAFYGQKGKEILKGCNGFANLSEKIDNRCNTRFAIASGSKIFTAVAICMLVEAGDLSFDSKLTDVIDVDFPYVDENITVHHLLTHTSGVYDYFNEQIMEDFEALWNHRPMYHIRSPKDFLSMFQYKEMQDNFNRSFQYNNSGYILLGLIVEYVAKTSFFEFVEEHIFQKVGMCNSGYFELDCLPDRTALGYILKEDGTWKTNIYALPAKGGPDGGAYVTAGDMVRFWQALTNDELLSKEMTEALLEPQEVVVAEDNIYYGYCGYIELDDEKQVVKFIQMGYDPGVNFRAIYHPRSDMIIVVCSNQSEGAYDMLKEIENIL